jgi:multidrug resistance efflux pump
MVALSGCDRQDAAIPSKKVAMNSDTQSNAPSSELGTPSVSLQRFEGACILKPTGSLKIKSQFSGEVTNVFVNIGDRVTPGQILLQVSTREQKTMLERLDFSSRRIVNRGEILKLQLQRAVQESEASKPLYHPSRIGKEASILQEKQLELEQIKIELKDIEAQKRELVRQISLAQIRANFKGTVVARNVEPGQVIGAAIGVASGGDVLIELATVDDTYFDCGVHAADGKNVKIGSKWRVTGAQFGRESLEIRVTKISPTIESISGIPQLKFSGKLQAEPSTPLLLGTQLTIQLVKNDSSR